MQRLSIGLFPMKNWGNSGFQGFVVSAVLFLWCKEHDCESRNKQEGFLGLPRLGKSAVFRVSESIGSCRGAS